MCAFVCVESRLGHAQAGVLCDDCLRRELVPIRDDPPGGPDPRQEGWTVDERRSVVWLTLWFIEVVFVHHALFPQKTQKERSASEKILLIGDMQSRELLLF